MARECASVLALLLLAVATRPGAALLGNLACSAQLVNRCGGANLVMQTLEPPFTETPEFCAPECLAAASEGECEGSDTGQGLIRTCEQLDCFKPVYAECSKDSCSEACGNALARDVCSPFNEQLIEMNLDPAERGANSLLCLSNTCAVGVNAACGPGSPDGVTDAICSAACAAAIASPACDAVPGTVPLNLTRVAGPDSPACLYHECSMGVVSACGDLSSPNALAEVFCSQTCADALAAPACADTAFEAAATQYGPEGTACASLACAQAVVETCGSVDTSSALAFAGSALPKVCSTACADLIESPICVDSELPGLRDIAGPDTVACQQSQCLVTAAVLCELDLSGPRSDVFAANAATVCQPNCRLAIDNPACSSSGLQAAHTTYCDCAPALLETCGLDVNGEPAPWDELVREGRLCSVECQEVLSNGCKALLPETLDPLYDYLCTCGVDLVSACNPLQAGPYVPECCAAAQSSTCNLTPIQRLMDSLPASLPAPSDEFLSVEAMVSGLPAVGEPIQSGISDLRVVETAVNNVLQSCNANSTSDDATNPIDTPTSTPVPFPVTDELSLPSAASPDSPSTQVFVLLAVSLAAYVVLLQ
mmetsp:Transcript_32230/g.57675  ORF Transcript_32230/g.57675 Transcript_32230/m.57675 type:complete len:596 (-) Transcript_32230:370-2157(-)